jgi:cyclase
MSWDVETIVPGHGPIVEKSALKDFRAYFEYMTREARRRYDAGMSVTDAAYDIDLSQFRGWIDEERIVVNINTLYRDFGASGGLLSPFERRTWMGRYRREQREKAHAHAGHGHSHRY